MRMVERLFAAPVCRQRGFSRLNAQAGPGPRLIEYEKCKRGSFGGGSRDGGGRGTDPCVYVRLREIIARSTRRALGENAYTRGLLTQAPGEASSASISLI